MLYGVDFLTTNAIRDRFQAIQAEIQSITWINDSAVKVLCRSEAEADRMLKLQVKEIKLQDEEERLRDWFALKPYTLYSFERPLLARYATSAQDLPKQVASKFAIYAEAKKGLAPFLLKQFAAEEKFKTVVEEIEAKRQRRRRPWGMQRRDQGNQPYRSRSRDKTQFMRHQRQYAQNENGGQQRVNRFQRKWQRPERVQLQEHRAIKYAHQPVRNQDDSFHFNSSGKRSDQEERSYELSASPVGNTNRKNINTDFEYNHQVFPNKALDLSICYKTKQKRGGCEPANDLDSELSFNDFGTFSLRKEKQPDEDNRLDYRYDPNVKQTKKNNNDCSFLLGQRSRLKQEESRSSFQENNSPYNDQISESSDFFDFRENKPKPKESTLDSSFRYEKKPTPPPKQPMQSKQPMPSKPPTQSKQPQQPKQKPKVNNNILDDDDSY